MSKPILQIKLRNAINRLTDEQTKDLEYQLHGIIINGIKRGCSGFIRNNANGSVIYVNTEPTIWGEVMYRYAKNMHDYHSYTNHFTKTLDELAAAIIKALHKTPAEAGEKQL